MKKTFNKNDSSCPVSYDGTVRLFSAFSAQRYQGPCRNRNSSRSGDAKAEGSADGNAQENTASQGQKIVTMAMTAPWDTLIPFNTTNANTDAVLELIF